MLNQFYLLKKKKKVREFSSDICHCDKKVRCSTWGGAFCCVQSTVNTSLPCFAFASDANVIRSGSVWMTEVAQQGSGTSRHMHHVAKYKRDLDTLRTDSASLWLVPLICLWAVKGSKSFDFNGWTALMLWYRIDPICFLKGALYEIFLRFTPSIFSFCDVFPLL